MTGSFWTLFRKVITETDFEGNWPAQRILCAIFALLPVCAFIASKISGVDTTESIGAFPNAVLIIIAQIFALVAAIIYHRFGEYRNISYCPSVVIWTFVGFRNNPDEPFLLVVCIIMLIYMAALIAATMTRAQR